LINSVNNFFVIDNSKLVTLQIPVLKNMNFAQITNISAIEIEMPMLENVFRQMDIFNNPNLNSLSLPFVKKGHFSLNDINNLSELNLSKLTEGSVNIIGSELSIVDLPKLVNGAISISDTKITSLNLPLLKQAQNITMLNNNTLTTVGFPELEKFNTLEIRNNELLSTLNLSKVTEFNSFSYDTNNVINLELPMVSSVGNTIIDSTTISNVNVPETNLNKGINIGGMNLVSFSAPLLTNFEGAAISFNFNENLETVNIPNLRGRGGSITFSFNRKLTSALNFPNVTELDILEIQINSLVTQANFDSLERVNGSKFIDVLGLRVIGTPLENISFPSLRVVGSSATNPTTLRVDAILSAGINLPLLEEFFDLDIRAFNGAGSSTASIVTMGSVKDFNSLDITGIDTGSLDGILNQLVSITPILTNKTLNIQAPSTIGMADLDTLIANGNTVTIK